MLQVNYKENLMIRFSANKKPTLKPRLYLVMSPWQQHIGPLKYKKNNVCVVNLPAANFGDQGIKGFRGKGERDTGIQNCVQLL